MRAKDETLKSKMRRRLWPALLLLLLLAGLVIGGWWFFLRPAPEAQVPRFSPNATVGALPGRTEEQIREMLQQQVDDTSIAFTINSSPVFANGSAKGDLMLESPANNTNNIRFVIVRDDTAEQLYDSGLMRPNSYILEDALQTDTPLAAGSYPCTATITLYSAGTGEPLGLVQAALTITVEN